MATNWQLAALARAGTSAAAGNCRSGTKGADNIRTHSWLPLTKNPRCEIVT